MRIGIGLPNAVPGTTGEELLGFARRADELEFSSLGTIDRLLYGNYEPLAALAAAAAVTERIELITSVMLGPLRTNAALTAKQALSINAISAGRLTLGIGLGAREDDYEVSGIDGKGKGAQLDAILETMTATFADERIGPRTSGAPRILIGGHADASFERAARVGEGWIAGAIPPDMYAGLAPGAQSAWEAAGRDDRPRMAALGYFALGDGAEQHAREYLTDYYAFLGDELAAMIASGAATDAEAVRGHVAAFEAAGCDELILLPCAADAGQVDLLREAVAS